MILLNSICNEIEKSGIITTPLFFNTVINSKFIIYSLSLFLKPECKILI